MSIALSHAEVHIRVVEASDLRVSESMRDKIMFLWLLFQHNITKVSLHRGIPRPFAERPNAGFNVSHGEGL